jgi:SulP family sulfate permease
MRGVPHIDMSGLEAIRRLHEQLTRQDTLLMFAGVHRNAMRMMERAGLVEEIGRENFFWSSDQASC